MQKASRFSNKPMYTHRDSIFGILPSSASPSLSILASPLYPAHRDSALKNLKTLGLAKSPKFKSQCVYTRGLILFAFIIFSAYGSEVDIVSSFNIDELPSKLLNVKQEFTISCTRPTDYLTGTTDYQSLQRIIVFDPFFGGGVDIMPMLPKEKLVLFVWEPDVLSPDIYDAYSRVYTWDDTLIDHVKFFRFNYPYLMPYREGSVHFGERKLCTIVVGNWTSQRLNVLKFFEDNYPKDLECYGRYPPGLENASMHKGQIPGLHSGEEKISTLQNYRFCICFENTIGLQGYITEKIFSCFAAGCVPVYWGSDNIERYIPKSCFIDYRDFATPLELYEFLSNMSEETHRRYIGEIKQFLHSEQAQQFSPEFFEKLIYQAIGFLPLESVKVFDEITQEV